MEFGFSHIDKHENDEFHGPSLTEKPQTCTMVVTTHGRALLFARDDTESNFILLAEVRLKYPFIHFQELVSTQTKLSKMLPSVGVFVISSIDTSLVFEVETFEVNPWTEALAKSKFNEIERDKLAEYESQQTKIEAIVAPVPKRYSPSAISSPKLLDSPTFDSPKKSTPQMVSRSSDIKSTTNPTHSPRESNSGPSHMLKRKILSSGPRSKPPPVSPPPISSPGELNHHTGLPVKSDSNGMLHAAQLAVSQTTHAPNYLNRRRSSFTKENGTKVDLNKLRSQNNQTNGNKTPQRVTQMNSKFLARSTRKK